MAGDRSRITLAASLVFFALLAFVHAVRLPLFEGPDEPDNLQFVRYLAMEGALPTPATEPTDELEALGRGTVPPLWFASQVLPFRWAGCAKWNAIPAVEPRFKRRGGDSPLHFRHGRDERSPWTRAGTGIRVLRMTAILWGALALVGVFFTAMQLTRSTSRAAMACALAATTPQLQHLAGTITMDLSLAAWGSLSLAACCSWIVRGSARSAGAAGFFAGLACLTKLNGLVLFPCLLLAGFFAIRRDAYRQGAGRRGVLACLVAFAAVAGPYFLWGWIESGHPLWAWVYQMRSPYHVAGGSMAGDPLFDWTVGFFGMLLLTWMGNFGWTAAWLPFAWVGAFGLLFLAGGLGFLAALDPARGRSEEPPFDRRAGAFLGLCFVIALSAEAAFNSFFFQPQARHLYAFLPAVIVPLALGLDRLRLLRAAVIAQAVTSVVALAVVLEDFRPAGWNEDPQWSVTDDGRRAGSEGSVPEVPWLAVPSDAAVPTLAWRTRDGAVYDVALGIENPTFEHLPWRGIEATLFLARRDLAAELRADLDLGRISLPPDVWAELSSGTTVFAQVLELDVEGVLAGRSTVRAIRKP